jgi:two-component system NarL family response regulator
MLPAMNICIVEDHRLLLENLRLLLQGEPDIAVTGAFASAEEAIAATDWSRTDLLLADIDLPGMSGVELIRRVKQVCPAVDAMAYTISEDRAVVMAAIRAGASGYLLKGSTPRVLIESVRELHEGGAPMSPKIARKLIAELRLHDESPGADGPRIGLTQREIEVVRLVERGLAYGEISDALHISPHTVHSHIKHIYEKIHASSRSEMLVKARKLGVI